jgi:hypothetical protein
MVQFGTITGTPHGLKPGGFSVHPRSQRHESPKARPAPLVGQWTPLPRGVVSSKTAAQVERTNVQGAFVLFPVGTTYHGTRKYD